AGDHVRGRWPGSGGALRASLVLVRACVLTHACTHKYPVWRGALPIVGVIQRASGKGLQALVRANARMRRRSRARGRDARIWIALLQESTTMAEQQSTLTPMDLGRYYMRA